MSEGDFLSRWSRRKHAAKAGRAEPEAAAVPAKGATPTPPEAAPAAPAVPAPAEPPLPPVESLTPESDFAPFMQANVDGGVRRAALKTLFQDPRFNVMDGLDVYIDDYTKADPLPEGWLEKMNQVAHLGHYQPPPEPAEPAEAAAASAAESPPEALTEASKPALDDPAARIEGSSPQDSARSESEPHPRS